MKLVVGLGNPGPEYEATRHNIGFQVVDAFAKKFRIELTTHEKEALTGRGRAAARAVMLAKPLTFMNLSGEAVSRLVRAYVDSPAEMIVVYDDVDLPLGRIRLRERGSAGTHNGMKSIIDSIGTGEFARLRVGIGAPAGSGSRLRDYVLDEFPADEREIVDRAVARSIEALVLFVRDDMRRAMNQFNRDPEAVGEETEQSNA